MASNMYQAALQKLVDRNMAGTIHILNDTIKVMLVSTAYTPDKDHDFVSDVVANELSGTGYAGGFSGSGRKTLSSKTIGKNDATDKMYFDAADSSWTAINAGTVGYAIIFKEITDDASSPVIACVDISPDVATNGGDYTIQWHADGIFTIAA